MKLYAAFTILTLLGEKYSSLYEYCHWNLWVKNHQYIYLANPFIINGLQLAKHEKSFKNWILAN